MPWQRRSWSVCFHGTITCSHALLLSACRISARTKAVPPTLSTRVRRVCFLLGLRRCAGINFDLESFKQQLTRLAMPHQQFTFGQVRTLVAAGMQCWRSTCVTLCNPFLGITGRLSWGCLLV